MKKKNKRKKINFPNNIIGRNGLAIFVQASKISSFLRKTKNNISKFSNRIKDIIKDRIERDNIFYC